MPCACPRLRRNGAAVRCSKEPSSLQFNPQTPVIERPVFSLIGYVAWGHEFFALPMRRRMVLLFSFCCGEKRSFGHSFLLAGNDGFCLPRAFGGGVVVGSGTLTYLV